MPTNFGSFTPIFGSQFISLTSAPSAGVAVSTAAGGPQGMMISNTSTNDAYIWFFPTSTGVASLGTTAAVGLSIPVFQRGNKTFTVPPLCFVSGMTTGAGLAAVLNLAPGMGIP